MRIPLALRLVALALVAALAGCAKRAEVPAESYGVESYYGEEADYGGGYGGGAPPSRSRGEMAKSSAAYAPAPMAMDDAEPAPAAEAGPGSSPPTNQPAAERMVHYNGYLQLRVTRPEELVQQVVDAAEAAGGYVERRSLSSVTVRVPVAQFEPTFKALQALGDVVYRSVTAEDVTEAYADVALRLRTARETRARLQELLAKATDEAEKIELLREIQRLTEEIDLMESRMRTLSALADFSRISVDAQGRQDPGAQADVDDLEGFGFVGAMSPFHNDLVWLGRYRPLPVPAGMVALDTKRRFIAESADGSVLRAVRLPNDPEGDSAFWLAAVRSRLEPEFTNVTQGELGGFLTVRFEQAGEAEPYVYIVGVRADGRHLDVLELYYPSRAHEERNAAGVSAALTEEGS